MTTAAGPAGHVLVVARGLGAGGTERHLLAILPRLRARGIDVRLFAWERGGTLERAFLDAGVPLIGPPPTSRPAFRALRGAYALWRELWTAPPLLVHFFLPEPYILGTAAAIASRVGLRVMSRRSLADYQRRRPLAARLERWSHRATAAFLGNSLAVCRELVMETRRPEAVGLLPSGVDVPAPLDPAARVIARDAANIPDAKIVIAVVANLFPYKGHADLLRALAVLPTDGWRLLLIGRDAGAGPSLRKLAVDLGIDHNIDWLGERHDVASLLAASDIFVLPSHEEGLSVALLEAMAFGLPCIATAVGGNLDALSSPDTGILVPPRDPMALAVVLRSLFEEPARRTALGVSARKRVQAHFSTDACVAGYERFYREWRWIGRRPTRQILTSQTDVDPVG